MIGDRLPEWYHDQNWWGGLSEICDGTFRSCYLKSLSTLVTKKQVQIEFSSSCETFMQLKYSNIVTWGQNMSANIMEIVSQWEDYLVVCPLKSSVFWLSIIHSQIQDFVVEHVVRTECVLPASLQSTYKPSTSVGTLSENSMFPTTWWPLCGRNLIEIYHIVDLEVDFSVTPSYSGVTLKFTMW